MPNHLSELPFQPKYHRHLLQPLQVVHLGDRALEPAERLRRHRAVREGHDIGADRGVQLGQKFLAAAVVVVGRSLVRVRASSRPSLVRRPKVVMRMQRAMRPRQRLQNLQLRSMLTHL